ncbi:MAG: class I poly(R)-hydroxyalkanoic acid synthase, partial [Candidatus Eremiobacteraeota bacterium]|nr:class I poly(R)-hydroxyalkanoic acid synthase [Candidatus Eremiobacteraeota bacterium]
YWAGKANLPSADDWFAAAEKRPGSWWSDWIAWLQQRSGERVAAPAALGSKKLPPLAAAPGTYVLEKA